MVHIEDLSKKNGYQQTSEKNINYLSDFYKKNNIVEYLALKKIISGVGRSLYFKSWCFYISRIICFECSFYRAPLPTSKDNHPLENANFYKDHNCCWVIEQKDFENEIERI